MAVLTGRDNKFVEIIHVQSDNHISFKIFVTVVTVTSHQPLQFIFLLPPPPNDLHALSNAGNISIRRVVIFGCIAEFHRSKMDLFISARCILMLLALLSVKVMPYA
jgi:hypothetical protein